MSQKKNKKRKPQNQKANKNPGELQQTEKVKRFKPAARNLLWLDLIFLAAVQLMLMKEFISVNTANIASVFGLVLLLAALYIQFMPEKKTPKPPRL